MRELKVPPNMVVQQVQRHRVRRIARRRQLGADDRRFAARPAVDQVDHRFSGSHLRHILLRRFAGLPAAEGFLQQRLDFRQRGVAHHQQGRVVRLEPVLVVFHQVGAVMRCHRRLGAGAGQRQA
jgi:hypothetical protein